MKYKYTSHTLTYDNNTHAFNPIPQSYPSSHMAREGKKQRYVCVCVCAKCMCACVRYEEQIEYCELNCKFDNGGSNSSSSKEIFLFNKKIDTKNLNVSCL